MEPIHEYDINTGKIFQTLYIKRTRLDEIFIKPDMFYEIAERLQYILKRKGVATQRWEEMTPESRAEYMERYDKNTLPETMFLNHFAGHQFNVVHYVSDCVLTYENDNVQYEFRLFFALKIAFTDIEKMEAFLDYQLKKNFDGEMKPYAKFLDDALLAHQSLIKEAGKREKVNRYIQVIEKTPQTITEYNAEVSNAFIKERIRVEGRLEELKEIKEKRDFIAAEILEWRNFKFKSDTRFLERAGIAYDKKDELLLMKATCDEMPNQVTYFLEYLEERRNYFKDISIVPPAGETKMLQATIPFDYSNKDKYFFEDKLSAFKQIEIELLQKEFLKASYEWAAEKNKLVAFIHILYKLHYLKPAIGREKEKSLLNKYRKFFEKRYNMDITKAFQPSQFNMGKLRLYKSDFYFIAEIDTI